MLLSLKRSAEEGHRSVCILSCASPQHSYTTPCTESTMAPYQTGEPSWVAPLALSLSLMAVRHRARVVPILTAALAAAASSAVFASRFSRPVVLPDCPTHSAAATASCSAAASCVFVVAATATATAAAAAAGPFASVPTLTDSISSAAHQVATSARVGQRVSAAAKRRLASRSPRRVCIAFSATTTARGTSLAFTELSMLLRPRFPAGAAFSAAMSRRPSRAIRMVVMPSTSFAVTSTCSLVPVGCTWQSHLTSFHHILGSLMHWRRHGRCTCEYLRV